MSILTKDLVVIEAAGKLRQLHTVLDKIGLRATCIATLGHVLESPSHLRPLEIVRHANGEYVEARRVCPRPEAYERLSEELRRLRGRLLIATDDDQEGHAIAEDVAALARSLRPEIIPLRVLATALTEPALRSALALASAMEPRRSAPAIARRIADRAIAAAFSRPEDGIVVGRVTAAIAGLARDDAFPTHAVSLQIPAQDGCGVFRARAYVRGVSQAEALMAVAGASASMISAGTATVSPLSAPPTHAAYLMAMGEGGRMSLSDAAKLLQGLYESGVVSYPRTAGQRYRHETRVGLARLAQAHGLRPAVEPIMPSAGIAEPHEPLHVVDTRVFDKLDLSKPMSLQRDDRAAALSWISRQMLEAVVAVQREHGDASNLPAPLAALNWTRERGAVPAWFRRSKEGLRPLTQEQSLLQGMVTAGIGRPSTYVGHAVRAIERGLVAADNSLGMEGRRVLAAAPGALSQAAVCRAIERGCEDAADAGVGPTVDRLLGLAAGRQADLLANLGALLQSPLLEEPTYAFVP